MTDQAYSTFAAAFQAEHHEMSELVQRLRQVLGGNRAWSPQAAREAVEAIASLQAHLKHHFMVEEAGGYLEEALIIAPRFSDLAAKLLAEHPVLLARTSETTALARRAAAEPVLLEALKKQVTELLGNLVAHETAENRIIQQALNSGVEVD
ncbi:MAG TPA: hemerythrin domain-containing protein [Pirellulales bacterium]|nr:hemerythrin domain-containing protein [Pirellulales bacterium]